MQQRIAGALALIAFALCLMAGLQAGNTFTTTILRALFAMAVTFVVGLILGAMGRRMLDENLKREEERLRNSTKLEPNDR